MQFRSDCTQIYNSFRFTALSPKEINTTLFFKNKKPHQTIWLLQQSKKHYDLGSKTVSTT